MLSARNQITGQIKAIKKGVVTAEVTVGAGGLEIVSSITLESAERMQLAVGDQVTAVVKASDVMIAKG